MTGIGPARLSARLVMSDGRTVRVLSVPPAPPATSGNTALVIPYPADAGKGTVTYVTVDNEELGTVLSRDIPFTPIGPGESLRIEVGGEDVDAATMEMIGRLLGDGQPPVHWEAEIHWVTDEEGTRGEVITGPLRAVECHLRANQDRIRSVELKPRRP